MSAFLENENGHVWHEKVFSSMQIKCCMNCGFIKNEKQPNKPCPGPVYVGFRASDLTRADAKSFESGANAAANSPAPEVSEASPTRTGNPTEGESHG